MATIAVLITDMFEDLEYTNPAAEFTNAGHKIVHIGMNKGDVVRGKKEGTEVRIDRRVTDSSADAFDALLVPGGYSPDKLRIHDDAVDFVRQFMKADKPVFSICHAPQILITAQVLDGRTITGWKSIIQDIKNAGAKFVDEEVVIDGNLISSRSPADLPAFTEACLRKLAEIT